MEVRRDDLHGCPAVVGLLCLSARRLYRRADRRLAPARSMSRHVSGADPTAHRALDDDYRAGSSRPSKTNCETDQSDPDEADSPLDRGYWWKRKNEVTDRMRDELPDRMTRPASVRGGELLREDATNPRHDGGYRSAPMLSIVNEFLKWYNGYRYAHLRFKDPDGNTVRSKMENSHQPGYGNRYYARFKGLERQVCREYDDPHSVILTFSGSHENADGRWRCPVDHLRDVVDSWRPDDDNGVYHALRYALEGREWEYCVAVEHNSKGYGHVHVGVFVDGEVSKEDFHPVIDKHLERCDIAHPDAHDYYHNDPEKRPISVNKINPDLDPDDYRGEDDVQGEIGNLGSYLAEYIGATADSELFERSSEELMFRAACWASGTQRVRFSKGANEMIDRDLDRTPRVDAGTQHVRWEPGTTAEDIKAACKVEDRSVSDIMEGIEPEWTIEGIGRVDADGEDVFRIEQSGVEYVEIEGAEHLDPPSTQPSHPPTPVYQQDDLSQYST